MRIITGVGLILFGICVVANAELLDDFESYTLNTWPALNWVGDGNAKTDPANNRVVLDPTDASNQALKLYGVVGGNWASLAYYPATFSNGFSLYASVYTGSENILSGNQPTRAELGMRTGTYWYGVTNPARDLMQFQGSGTILAADGTTNLGTYQTNTWYDVGIRYTRNTADVSLKYWLDGDYLGAVTTPIWDQSVESGFDHVQLAVGGGTSYFDSIYVSELPPTQKVYLAFDAEEVPFLIERKQTKYGNSEYVNKEGSMASIHDMSDLSEYRAKIETAVNKVFAASGVTNLEFVDSPDGATTVWFAKHPLGEPSYDINWDLSGRAVSGVDRFNMAPSGDVVVFVFGDPDEYQNDAELIAHELGHTFGLRHINPKAPDGKEISCIMDYDFESGLEQFYNGVAEITEPPSNPHGGTGDTHNPVYHLKHYLDDIPHDHLITDVKPGNWDLAQRPKMTGVLHFGDSDHTLYDVYLLGGQVGFGDCAQETLAHFDAITLSQLSDYQFALEYGLGIEMYAASTLGGEWDVALATGSPFEADTTLIYLALGDMPVYLQMWSESAPLGYITLAEGVLTGAVEVIPAPGAILLGTIGAGLARWLRRRRTL